MSTKEMLQRKKQAVCGLLNIKKFRESVLMRELNKKKIILMEIQGSINALLQEITNYRKWKGAKEREIYNNLLEKNFTIHEFYESQSNIHKMCSVLSKLDEKMVDLDKRHKKAIDDCEEVRGRYNKALAGVDKMKASYDLVREEILHFDQRVEDDILEEFSNLRFKRKELW